MASSGTSKKENWNKLSRNPIIDQFFRSTRGKRGKKREINKKSGNTAEIVFPGDSGPELLLLHLSFRGK